MTQVKKLKVGNLVKINNCVVHVNKIEESKAIVSKQPFSPYCFSIDFYTHLNNDLINRVEVVNA